MELSVLGGAMQGSAVSSGECVSCNTGWSGLLRKKARRSMAVLGRVATTFVPFSVTCGHTHARPVSSRTDPGEQRPKSKSQTETVFLSHPPLPRAAVGDVDSSLRGNLLHLDLETLLGKLRRTELAEFLLRRPESANRLSCFQAALELASELRVCVALMHLVRHVRGGL